MENIDALVIGIASSLIATATFVCFAEVTRRVLLPWYADRIYRGVRLDGKWIVCRIGDINIKSTPKNRNEFDLKQKGDQITDITILQSPNEPSPTIYKLRGQFRDGYFSATAWPISTNMMDAMSCLFRVFYDDKTLHLKGLLSFMNSKTAQIETMGSDIEFIRTSS